MARYRDNLIIDVGLHDGTDSLFYLQKGFSVVAVEADPAHVSRARERFADYLASGTLHIVAAAVGDTDGPMRFYRNLDKDDWGSIDPSFGARQGTRHEEIVVPGMRFERIIEEFGVPYYLKIDIEGGDIHVLNAIGQFDVRPRYVSVEAHGPLYLAILRDLGYDAFKLINQKLHHHSQLPDPPRIGRYVDYRFGGYGSGPFGEETVGSWLPYGEMAALYADIDRLLRTYPHLLDTWFDLHARHRSVAPQTIPAPHS